MHFLIDANLPRAVADILRSYGHEATDVRAIGLGEADDARVASHAKLRHLCLITRDQDFGNIMDYPPEEYTGIVVLRPPEHAGRALVLCMVEQLLRQEPIVNGLKGHLVIVEPDRFRVRPAQDSRRS